MIVQMHKIMKDSHLKISKKEYGKNIKMLLEPFQLEFNIQDFKLEVIIIYLHLSGFDVIRRVV